MITYTEITDSLISDNYREPKAEVCDICGTELDDEGVCQNCLECKSMYKED